MDPRSAEVFIITVWFLCSAGIFTFLRYTATEHSPRLPSQLLTSVVAGTLLTVVLIIVNLIVTGGQGLVGDVYAG